MLAQSKTINTKTINGTMEVVDRIEILEKDFKKFEKIYLDFQRIFEEKFEEFNQKEDEYREFKTKAAIIQITQTVIIMTLIALHIFS